jgi:hypothetical protein
MNLPPKGSLPPRCPAHWATHVPARGGPYDFDYHTEQKHALSSLANWENGVLYQKVEGEWIEICRIENYYAYQDDTCYQCNTTVNSGMHKRKWLHDSDIIQRVTLCERCKASWTT